MQVKYAARNAGGDVMLDVKVSPITSQQQNTDDRDSPALELHAITAVDWLERRMQCTDTKTYAQQVGSVT